MIICRVVGTVVASANADGIAGPRYMLVQTADSKDYEGRRSARSRPAVADTIVALDAVQAGEGELVMVSQGSSTRQIPATREKAVDALIVGIVDMIDENGTLRYRKDG